MLEPPFFKTCSTWIISPRYLTAPIMRTIETTPLRLKAVPTPVHRSKLKHLLQTSDKLSKIILENITQKSLPTKHYSVILKKHTLTPWPPKLEVGLPSAKELSGWIGKESNGSVPPKIRRKPAACWKPVGDTRSWVPWFNSEQVESRVGWGKNIFPKNHLLSEMFTKLYCSLYCWWDLVQ